MNVFVGAMVGGFGDFPAVLTAAAVLGIGTGMVYPVLIAAVANRVPEAERATTLEIYRFFRDRGYAVGALIVGAGLARLAVVTGWTADLFLPLAVLAWMALARTRTPGDGANDTGSASPPKEAP